jgi:hypothetical protein
MLVQNNGLNNMLKRLVWKTALSSILILNLKRHLVLDIGIVNIQKEK